MPAIFEVLLINQEVVDAVRSGNSHKDLDDGWADNRYVEIRADSLDDAWARMRRKYPANKGYVIKTIEEVPNG